MLKATYLRHFTVFNITMFSYLILKVLRFPKWSEQSERPCYKGFEITFFTNSILIAQTWVTQFYMTGWKACHLSIEGKILPQRRTFMTSSSELSWKSSCCLVALNILCAELHCALFSKQIRCRNRNNAVCIYVQHANAYLKANRKLLAFENKSLIPRKPTYYITDTSLQQICNKIHHFPSFLF